MDGSDLFGQAVELRHNVLGSILAVLGDECIMPGDELIELRGLFFGERYRLRVDAAQGMDEVVRIFRIHRDPLPAFPRHRLAGCLELFEDQAVEELAVGVVAAVVFGEEIAKNDAAGLLIRFGADELGAAVGRAHMALGQELADHLRALVPCELLPDLLLSPVIVGEREGHELVERELAVAVARHERGAHGCELEALLHHGGSDAETRGDLFDTEASVIDELLEGLELIGRMHAGADHVLGKADLRGDAVGLDQARDRLVSLDPLLLCEDPERLAPALAGGDQIPARLFALAVPLWLDDERLEEPVCRDARGELLEPDLRRRSCGHWPVTASAC